MHWHNRHGEPCADAHDNWPDPIRVLVATLEKLEHRMSTQQTSIDAAVEALTALVAEVGDLKSQLAAASVDTVDTAKLDEAVAAAQAALAPADVPAQPADAPAAPVADAPVEQPAPAAAPIAFGDPISATA